MTDKHTYNELAQRVAESHYRILFEGANDSIFIIENYKFLECNKLTLKMFGCKKDKDIIGFYPWDFSPPYQPDGRISKEKAIEMMDISLAGKPQRFYWKHIQKDGTEFDSEVSLNRFETDGTNFLIAIVRDITDHKRTEEGQKKAPGATFQCSGNGPSGPLGVRCRQ